MNSCQCSIMFAPVKYEYIRANFSRCMAKGLRKDYTLYFVLDYAIGFLRPKQKNLSNYTSKEISFT